MQRSSNELKRRETHGPPFFFFFVASSNQNDPFTNKCVCESWGPSSHTIIESDCKDEGKEVEGRTMPPRKKKIFAGKHATTPVTDPQSIHAC